MAMNEDMVPASSVVIRGIDATTFSDMENFVKDLEARSIERLLRDLPKLAELSATKVSLVSYVFASKFKQATPEEKQLMQESAAATFEALGPGEAKDRVGAILKRLR